MSEREYDLAEILRSPLDPDPDETSRGGWFSTVLAFTVGAAAAAIAVALALAAGEPTPPTATAATGAPQLEVVVADPAPFPDGYVPVANDVAVRTEAVIVEEDRLLVPLTMVVRRGADPEAVARPLGGRWELRSVRGIVESQRLVFDPSLPGVVSVEFPTVAGEQPRELVLVERWDATTATGAVELPWPGVPYRTDAPIEIDVGSGVRLVLTEVELGNLLGQVRWELVGASLGLVDIDVDLLDASGDLFGSYVSTSHALDPVPAAGHHDYFWGPGFRVDQDEAATLRFTARVTIGTPASVEIAVPLTVGS